MAINAKIVKHLIAVMILTIAGIQRKKHVEIMITVCVAVQILENGGVTMNTMINSEHHAIPIHSSDECKRHY